MSLEEDIKFMMEDIKHRVGKTSEAMVQTLAKEAFDESTRMFGTYDHEGDWPGLAERTLVTHRQKQDLIAAAGFPGVDTPLVVSGELKESVGMSVTGDSASVGTNNILMTYHELGAGHVPPRPVFGPTANFVASKMDEILGPVLIKVMGEEHGD